MYLGGVCFLAGVILTIVTKKQKDQRKLEEKKIQKMIYLTIILNSSNVGLIVGLVLRWVMSSESPMFLFPSVIIILLAGILGILSLTIKVFKASEVITQKDFEKTFDISTLSVLGWSMVYVFMFNYFNC